MKTKKPCKYQHQYTINAVYDGKRLVAGIIRCKNCNYGYEIMLDRCEDGRKITIKELRRIQKLNYYDYTRRVYLWKE